MLRLDYLPNALFRWDGKKWQLVNEVLRAPVAGNTNTQLGTFVNNTATTTLSNGQVLAQRQALSSLFSIKSDV